MAGIVPNFYTVTNSLDIRAGWKNICIIPTGNVTLTNTLNPAQSFVIDSPFMIAYKDGDGYEGITITGTAQVIVNGAATLE